MKRRKIIVFLLIVICLFLVGCGANSNTSTLKEPEVTPEVKAVEETPALEDVIEETPTAVVLDNDSFISAISKEIKWALGPRDKIENISIEDGKLLIKISLERNYHTVERFSSVTDKILALEEGYDLWDSVTVDFGSLGSISKTKDDIVSEGNTYHFSVDNADIIK